MGKLTVKEAIEDILPEGSKPKRLPHSVLMRIFHSLNENRPITEYGLRLHIAALEEEITALTESKNDDR